MPQFEAGVSKTAKATMRNPTGKAFDYDGVLYMGTDLAVMAEAPFSLSAGQEKEVSFPVTMPSAPGVYPVYLGVFSEEESIALYQAEDVTVIERIVTEYALSVVSAPAQVASGQNFAVTVHLEIPQGELYPQPRYGGVVSEASFTIHARLNGPAQGAANAYGVPGVGANDLQLTGLRSIDYWYGTPLPRGQYNLQMRLGKQWVESVPGIIYSHSELPLGDYGAYAQIEIV